VPPDRVEAPATGNFAEKFRPALDLLLEAYDYAAQTSGNRWEFAIELAVICQLGLSHNDLRWLVRTQTVEHAREVTIPGESGREFRPAGDLTFTAASCFVLTAAGSGAARRFCSDRQAAAGPTNPPAPPLVDDRAAATTAGAPKWNVETRVLSFAGKVVKRFKWHAVNQESILAAFEEEGWPPRIDDPLPPQPDQDAKRRLSDTIKCLNRKQQHPLVHFRGDGTGEGVVWEAVAGAAVERAAE
jgi:hypothetical protein